MSVFSFLKSVLGRLTGNQLEGGLNPNERRYFNRHVINNPELIKLIHPSKGSFQILNLSYQGALIKSSSDGENLSGLILPANFVLSAMGTVIDVKVQKLEQRDGHWAVQFEHGNEGSIQNIGSIVEPIRCGSTAVLMPVDMSKPTAPDITRVRFFGDGPFDILIEKTSSGEITYMMSTIRRGADYGSLTWSKGQLQTQKSIDQQGVSARMSQTQETDMKLVWICAMACLGLNFPEGPACARILASHLKS